MTWRSFHANAEQVAEQATRITTKINGDSDDEVSLVSFGYSLKDTVAERRAALEAAVKARGVPAVIHRLEFLLQAWSGTQKFVESISQDMRYVHSLESTDEGAFIGEGI